MKAQQVNTTVNNIAAIDLGSNSFHMVVARVVGKEIQIVARHKQQVRLGAGLDNQGNLDKAAIDRGVECLAMFAERLEGFEAQNVKVAATFTLREAKNKKEFLKKAKAVFPYAIEVISGDEEARLIYHGVSNTLPGKEQKLVVDIGGGSTELVIGKGFSPLITCSKRMGCVSYNLQFFKEGKISKKHFEMAQLATEVRLESIMEDYQHIGWKHAFGCSGTIKAIHYLIIGLGFEDGIITKKRLNKLIEHILSVSHFSKLDLPGLSVERQPILAAGVAILSGIFNALNIQKMQFSSAALREGLLYELLEPEQESDIRVRTANNLAKRYTIDLEHASRVKKIALSFYAQCEAKDKRSELKELLSWSALLHEVGLNISHNGFHKHSAYILQFSSMPGFNQEQQLVLATLAKFHRKSLKLQEIPEFTLYKTQQIYILIRALRLACLLSIRRTQNHIPQIPIKTHEDRWILSLPTDEFENSKLLNASLKHEQALWQTAGWQLDIE